jgi:hypothetical protein
MVRPGYDKIPCVLNDLLGLWYVIKGDRGGGKRTMRHRPSAHRAEPHQIVEPLEHRAKELLS